MVLITPRILSLYHQGNCPYITKDIVLISPRALSLCHQEHCPYITKGIVLISPRTLSLYHQEHCLYITKDITTINYIKTTNRLYDAPSRAAPRRAAPFRDTKHYSVLITCNHANLFRQLGTLLWYRICANCTINRRPVSTVALAVVQAESH